ncbi:alpha/beta fold hydrolase [Xylophilus sp.]|uniref:alpha/beta fold hydrolase n=1 Tax=Xylophilus sp. TaxID=2653893 RepID=UPI0013BCDCC6|nr:alpha/beta hydrolase [Xylophilus sp.]KAF1047040.1 MAG: 2-succinyl-6-hydroxy-2,4-cyclohexadiene-1-carboxylate synthase [Xylophilus sp.]
MQPTLNYVTCPGPDAIGGAAGAGHRMAYWEWNGTGDPRHPHVVVCVHGLTRQGRDFDALALALAQRARVIGVDVVGRGRSDWLADAAGYQIPVYAGDMLALLAHLHRQSPIGTLDWVGTSMGGLIALALCGQPGLPLPLPVRRLVLNDIGPVLQWSALQRIGGNVGLPLRFDTLEQGADWLRQAASGFGPHTQEQWLALSRPMLVPLGDGGFRLHYDPAIAAPFRAVDEEGTARSEAILWQLYDHITASTLLVRGADSDLLSRETAEAMTHRGPHARLVEFDGVGHAPTFVAPVQIAVVEGFLFGPGSPEAP